MITGGTEPFSFICQIDLWLVLRIVNEGLGLRSHDLGESGFWRVPTGNRQECPPQGPEVQAQVPVSHPSPLL